MRSRQGRDCPPRRPALPQADLPFLSEGQLAGIIDLLPAGRSAKEQHSNRLALADPEFRRWLRREIERARLVCWQVYQLAPERWDSKREREAAATQLRALDHAASAFLQAVGELGPLALLRLTRNPDIFDLPSNVQPQWLQDSEAGFREDAISDAASGVAWLPGTARKEAEALESEASSAGGRPRALAAHQLVQSFASLWYYFGGRYAPNNRGPEGRSWPFLDFVEAVGKTVIPDFTGEAAARRFVASYNKVRRETGEIP